MQARLELDEEDVVLRTIRTCHEWCPDCIAAYVVVVVVGTGEEDDEVVEVVLLEISGCSAKLYKGTHVVDVVVVLSP